MLFSTAAFTKFFGIPMRNGLNGRGVRADSFLDDAAVEKMYRAVGDAGVARIVRYHADRGALAMQLAQQVHYRFAVLRVQVSSRLVRQQDGRRTDQRSRHGHALLLTAGKLGRI